MNPLRIFCSYSHKDEELRQRLEISLAPLVQLQLIDFWHDRKISAGREWHSEIDTNLTEADIILLLVSPDFLASRYVYDIELKTALERHARSEARVVPILMRPALWDIAPFAKLQALPANGTPLTRWPDSDEAWEDIARGILRLASELRSSLSERSHKIEVPPAVSEVGAARTRVRRVQHAMSSPRLLGKKRLKRLATPRVAEAEVMNAGKGAGATADAGGGPPQPLERDVEAATPKGAASPLSRDGAAAKPAQARKSPPAPGASLVDRLRDELRRFTPHDDLHLAPSIPAQKLTNSRDSCQVPPSEDIVALIDSTVLGSAKNALLVGGRAIYYRNDWAGKQPGAGSVSYADLASATFGAEGWTEVSLGPGQYFNVAGSGVKQATLIEILQAVQRVVAAKAPSSLPRPLPPAADESPSGHPEAEILGLLNSLTSAGSLYVHPRIPPNKLANSRKSCQVPEGERILGLLDCTTWGSAKHGFLFGSSGVYFHNDWTGKKPGPGKIPYSDFKGRVFRQAAYEEIDLGKEQYLVVAGSGAGVDKFAKVLYQLQALVTAVVPQT